MKKFKPFLIGAVAGSLVMFVSLQFHLIRSEDGFRLVPRTPQPSLGLFFVDLRGWTPEDYADRPELARALVAHGDTDLVASSVSDRLLDGVSEDGSTLDTLRGLMNESDSFGGLQVPSGISTGLEGEAGSDTLKEFPELLPILFNRDAKKPDANRIAQADDMRSDMDSRDDRGLPSTDQIFGPTNGEDRVAAEQPLGNFRQPARQAVEPVDPFRESDSASVSESPTHSQLPFTASEESDLISDMLFGEDDDVPVTDSGTSAGWQDTIAKSRDQFTDSVRSEVASRAGGLADNFRNQLQQTRKQAFDETLETMEEYSTRRIKESLPSSVGEFLNSRSPATPLSGVAPRQPAVSNRVFDALPPELEALQRGFDPFLK